MEQFSNRVEQELLQFRSREERLEKLFPSEKAKDAFMLGEKVKYYGYLLVKFKGTRNQDEMYLLKRLQIEKRQLEKELYPNRFVQVFRSVLRFLVPEKQYAAALQQDVLINRKRMLDEVSRCGFQIAPEKILPKLESGSDRFSVAISNYVNENERMEHQLVFVKDISGSYSFDGFKASLHNETGTESFREHFFKNDHRIFTPEQAFHLLAGRALEKEGSWIQFDLNDKSADTCYRLKEFRSDYGFDLKNSLEAMPLKDKSPEKIDELLSALKNGQERKAVFEVKEKEHIFLIKANPQFRTVDTYDEQLKKINLSALRGRNVPSATRKAAAAEKARPSSKRKVSIQ